MLYMELFSVVKIKFKMQFCNLDDFRAEHFNLFQHLLCIFNLPFRPFWSISGNFTVHFGRFGQQPSRYIGPFFYILIN